MKIKRKVQKNLPQLIEWGWENGTKNKNFESEGGAIVYFDYDGNLTCARGFVPQDFFTVTTEEEITEDTKLPKMLLVYDSDDTHFVKGTTVYSLSKSCVKAIHLVNDDLTMTLIWRDGRLIE